MVIGFFSLAAHGQIVVQAKVVDGKAFIGHTVTTSETLYGIARIYGISPKYLAIFNGLNIQKGIEKYTVLKIPITPASISAISCANCATIKYAVQLHEGLYRIGVNFGNIGTQNLIKLNKLGSDNLITGQMLIVGYMKATGNEISMVDNSQLAATNPIGDALPTTTTQETAVVNINPKQETVALRKQEPVITPQVTLAQTEKKQGAVAAQKNEIIAIGANGFFGAQYNNKFAQSRTGTAGIFKSISGWQDNKYYALINNVAAGTILRISDSLTGKAIYAKVLGQIPYLKGSDALFLRISDAGVAALGVSEETMEVTVSY